MAGLAESVNIHDNKNITVNLHLPLVMLIIIIVCSGRHNDDDDWCEVEEPLVELQIHYYRTYPDIQYHLKISKPSNAFKTSR